MSRRAALVWGLSSLACLWCACRGGQAGPGLEPPEDGLPGLGAGAGVAGVPTVSPPGDMGGAGAAGASGAAGAVPAAGANAQAGSGQAGAGGAAGASGAPNDAQDVDDGGVPLDASDGGGGGSDARDPFFVGRWVVDQPSHALYEATLYELAEGGMLFERGVSNLGGDTRVTGSVATEAGTLCTFARDWRSPAARTLVVGLECSDSIDREATLQLLDGDTAVGVGATVVSVAGESGWDHRDFPWSFRKCPDDGACPPF